MTSPQFTTQTNGQHAPETFQQDDTLPQRVTIALPSKGAIAEPTLAFLQDCGLRVEKPNPRQYVGTIAGVANADVLFQRVIDVVYKVADGTAQLGITGYDVVREYGNLEDLIVMQPDLRYGYCRLVVAVPEAWIDVETVDDLAEVALDFRDEKQRNIRVATTYPNMTRQFMQAKGISHFALAHAEGAIEAAPTIGYADFIVDLVQTGTTLRENHLKALDDGIIVESQACFIGNRRRLRESAAVLETARILCEHMDASLRGRQFSQITVNIQGKSAQEIAARIADNPITRGLQSPTIAPIYSNGANDGAQWFTATIIVNNKLLLTAVEYLRTLGASQSSVIPVRYIFLEQSPTFAQLCDALHL